MKLIILLLLLTGCILPVELEPYETIQDVFDWVSDNIEYSLDNHEEWQSPKQTVELGTGDCEDFVILAMYLLNRDFGYLPDMIIGVSIATGNAHCWLSLNDVWYEIQLSGMDVTEIYDATYTIELVYTYDQVMVTTIFRGKNELCTKT